MHYTARSKAEPEFLVVKRREHARTFESEHQLEAMPMSNRSSCAIIGFLLHSSSRR